MRMGEKITEPNEASQSRIIRHDLDYNPDLENFLIDQEIIRTLALSIFICLFTFLINTWGW